MPVHYQYQREPYHMSNISNITFAILHFYQEIKLPPRVHRNLLLLM